MTQRSFDRVARCYVWLERLTFGAQLQHIRTAWLAEARAHQRILILGEGDGRFLAALCRAHPQARIVVIDASARMIQLAQERLRQVDRALERVEFRHEAAQTALAACAEFELVVCNFFLDCFDASELNALLPRIAASLTVGGQLWLGDFRPPKRGIARVLGPPLLAAMHSFFRWTAGISARRLADLPIVLRAHGWHPLQSVERAGGLLHASIWQRPAP